MNLQRTHTAVSRRVDQDVAEAWREAGESAMLLQGPDVVRVKIEIYKQRYPAASVRAFVRGAREMGYTEEMK